MSRKGLPCPSRVRSKRQRLGVAEDNICSMEHSPRKDQQPSDAHANTNKNPSFSVADLVWIKWRSYPFWPALVLKLLSKKKCLQVRFAFLEYDSFGKLLNPPFTVKYSSKTMYSIETNFLENKIEGSVSARSQTFDAALKKIETYLQKKRTQNVTWKKTCSYFGVAPALMSHAHETKRPRTRTRHRNLRNKSNNNSNKLVPAHDLISEDGLMHEHGLMSEHELMSEDELVPEHVLMPEHELVPEHVFLPEHELKPELMHAHELMPEDRLMPEHELMPVHPVHQLKPEPELMPEHEHIPEPELMQVHELMPEDRLMPEHELIHEQVLMPEHELDPEPELMHVHEFMPEHELMPGHEIMPAHEHTPECDVLNDCEHETLKGTSDDIPDQSNSISPAERLPSDTNSAVDLDINRSLNINNEDNKVDLLVSNMEQTTECLDDNKLASLDMMHSKFLDDDDDDELPVFNVKQTNEVCPLKANDLVWVKWKQYPFWPALVLKLQYLKKKLQKIRIAFLEYDKQGKLIHPPFCIRYCAQKIHPITKDYCLHKDEGLRSLEVSTSFEEAMQKVESYLFNYKERAVTKFATEIFGVVPTVMDCALDNEDKFVCEESTKVSIDTNLDDEGIQNGGDGGDDDDDDVLITKEENIYSPETLKSIKKRHEECDELMKFILSDTRMEEHLCDIYNRKKTSSYAENYDKLKRTPCGRLVLRIRGFGPIELDAHRTQVTEFVVDRVIAMSKRTRQSNLWDRCGVDNSRVLDILVPEAITFAIENVRDVSREEAEEIFARGISWTSQEFHEMDKERIKNIDREALALYKKKLKQKLNSTC